MFDIPQLMVLAPALPLAAALVTAVFGPRLLRGRSHWPALLGVGGALLVSLLLLTQVYQASAASAGNVDAVGYEVTRTLWQWAAIDEALPGAGISAPLIVDVTLRADPLTAIMLAMVTFVALLVVIFASGYMDGDPGYWRFFTYVSLFVFSMVMLVSVSNFVLLFVFWEAVGVCSYLLIGFWYEKPEAAAAGKKAFLVNRIGDFGFALGVFLLWTTFGTLNFHDTTGTARTSGEAATASAVARDDVLDAGVEDAADAAVDDRPNAASDGQPIYGILGQHYLSQGRYPQEQWIITAACLLLFVGACGKSAQFPLHVWLPDAMEGPTPVSALIHAATMVTAGVYLVARCTPLYVASETAPYVTAAIGGTTAVLAALIALTQNDLKRVLAYSTVSQLGYMFLGLGTATLAGVTAGMFHLLTHAFFKALLFLGAGSVMHAMGGVIDMRHFSGLRRRLPVTHWTFLLGCLALSGVAPLAGFWSKDAVLGALHDRGHEGALPALYQTLYWAGLGAAMLTAFYTFRAFFLTFYGPERVPPEAGSHGHSHHAMDEGSSHFARDEVIGTAGGLRVGAALHPGMHPETTQANLAGVHDLPAGAGPLAPGAGASTTASTAASTAHSHAAHPAVGDPERVHESPPAMAVPLMILAAFAVAAGALSPYFTRFLGRTPSLAAPAVSAPAGAAHFHWDVAILSTLVAVAGIGLAALLYIRSRSWVEAQVRLRQSLPYRLSQGKFFIDEIYSLLIVWPIRIVGYVCYLAVDRFLIDGLVNLIGWLPRWIGSLLRPLQIGLVQFYAWAMVLGLLVLIGSLLSLS